MMIYPIGMSGQRLVFSTMVIEHFERHRQVRWWHREAGGQLFARFELPDVLIAEVTGPRRTDWRTRHGYRPNRRVEQKEIYDRHKRGFHFVGDWHTHPELIPSPSSEDRWSMHETVTRSQHALNGFLMVVVGQKEFPDGLFVGLVPRDHPEARELKPAI